MEIDGESSDATIISNEKFTGIKRKECLGGNLPAENYKEKHSLLQPHQSDHFDKYGHSEIWCFSVAGMKEHN